MLAHSWVISFTPQFGQVIGSVKVLMAG
jgi:hypothetical protein